MENEVCLHMVIIVWFLPNHHELKFILFDAYKYISFDLMIISEFHM